MNIFKDFFNEAESSGSPANANNDLIFAVDDQSEVLSLKFFLLVSAEESEEKEELKSIHEMIRDYYTECPKENAESLASFSAALVDHIAKAEDKEQEWTSIYKTFYEQIERLDKDQQKKFIIEVAPVTFVLKATPDAEKVYETYVFRMSGYESCLKLSKEEIISLLEDTKEFYNNAMASENNDQAEPEGQGDRNEADIIEEHCYSIVSRLSDKDEPVDELVKEIKANVENSSYTVDELAVSLSNWWNDKNTEGETVKAIQIGKTIFGLTQKGGPAFGLGVNYEKYGDKETALEYYIKAAEIRKERLGQNHEATVDAVKAAIRINDELGKFDFDLPAWFEDAVEDIDFDA